MNIFNEVINELEICINEKYDQIAEIGKWRSIDRAREIELELVNKAREQMIRVEILADHEPSAQTTMALFNSENPNAILILD